MARFYRIQIGAVHLTSDGTNAGIPCKLAVSGADALLQTHKGQTIVANDGTPVNQLFAITKGKPLEISVEVLPESVWNSLVSLINTALTNETTINIIGTGDVGDFDEDFLPLMPEPFSAAEFINSRIKNSIFRFITA